MDRSSPQTKSEISADRIALILQPLAGDTRRSILEKIDGRWRPYLERWLRQFEVEPPPPEEIERTFRELEDLLDKIERGEPLGTAAEHPGEENRDVGRKHDESDVKELESSLEKWPSEDLAEALKGESPGVVAAVLGALKGEQAAALLQHLPVELSGKAVALVGRPVPPELLSSIVRSLARKRPADPLSVGAATPEERVERIVELLQVQHPTRRTQLVTAIEQVEPDTAAILKDKLYSIEDWLFLDDHSIQLLLKEIAMDMLALALLDASEELRDKITRNMSKRAKENLLEEMELNESASKAKIEEAKKLLIQEFLRLDAEGNLTWIEQAGD